MIRLKSKFFIYLLVLPMLGFFLQACAPKPQEQPSCGFVQNIYGERISWKSVVPVQLYLHDSFPASMRPGLEAAIRVWEDRAGRSLFQIVNAHSVAGEALPRQDGVNVIYLMNTWEAEKSSEQARTSVYWVGDQIQEADIRLNDKDFNFYLDVPAAGKDVHLESLFIHELGHVLGLKHKDSQDSVMATYLSSLTQRKEIPETDIEDLKCEY